MSGVGAAKLATALELDLAIAVGQQPTVADALETCRQDMQQEAAHELRGIQAHGLVTRFVALVLPGKGDMTIGDRPDLRFFTLFDRRLVAVARIVDKHVDAAEARVGSSDRSGKLRHVGDIQIERERTRLAAAHELRDARSIERAR